MYLSLPPIVLAGPYSWVVAASSISSAPTPYNYAPPAVPTGLTAINGENAQVRLSWNAVAGATSYNLKRYTSSGGPYYPLALNLTRTSYTNPPLVNGQA